MAHYKLKARSMTEDWNLQVVTTIHILSSTFVRAVLKEESLLGRLFKK